MTPISPAHWLAEKRDSDTPTPVLPPTAIAAWRGSEEFATSAPYLIADSASLEEYSRRPLLFLVQSLFSLLTVSPICNKHYLLPCKNNYLLSTLIMQRPFLIMDGVTHFNLPILDEFKLVSLISFLQAASNDMVALQLLHI